MRGVALDQFLAEVPRDHEADAELGCVGPAPIIGTIGAAEVPALRTLLHRPFLERIGAFGVAQHDTPSAADFGCKPCRKSAARCACDAAVKMARLSAFKTFSQWSR